MLRFVKYTQLFKIKEKKDEGCWLQKDETEKNYTGAIHIVLKPH